jgi:short-subunit dehydrogenase
MNNAGVIQAGPAEEMTLADFEDAMATHFWGALYAIMAVVPAMKQRGLGRIVNISSIGGKVSVPHLLPYGASKFALVGHSEGLRAELAKDRIAVTTVIPGLMRTGSPPNAFFKGQYRKEYTWFVVSDSIPGISMSAARAARRIVSACRYVEAEIVLSVPAKSAVGFHALFPGLTSDILGLVNRALPAPGGIGTARALGRESTSAVTELWLTTPTQQAEREYNESGT